MGGLILLFLFFIPAGLVIYAFTRVESKRPRGEVRELLDERGRVVYDKNGKPLAVDEYGKVVSYDEAVAHLRRQQSRQGCLWFLMGWLIAGQLTRK
ncbi:MAG: hypothetical protein IJ523_09315 [Succinivibrionaceae bacterium]|nr:hypothetical protein [Succinivibrionaceae bacterium]